MTAQQPNHHQIRAEKRMIQRMEKPRRAALRNSFHSGPCDPGGTRTLQEQAELGAGAGNGFRAGLCLSTKPGGEELGKSEREWPGAQQRASGLSVGGTGRTSAAPSALGFWLRTRTAELPAPPLGRRGERNFLCGRRNRQPSPPQPHIPGPSQRPRASQTREFPSVPRLRPPGKTGSRMGSSKPVTDLLQEQVQTRTWICSHVPTT